jgi:hypothetical protein
MPGLRRFDVDAAAVKLFARSALDREATAERRLLAMVSEEHAAAVAELGRLTANADAIVAAVAAVDSDEAATLRIAELYGAIAKHVSDAAADAERAADLGPLRAAMAAVFDTSARDCGSGVGRRGRELRCAPA